MLLKMFRFNKVEKSVKNIEETLNTFLKDKNFKYACQSENTIKGKLIVSVYHEKGEGKTKAKVFKDVDENSIEKQINTFLSENHKVKFMTQTSSTSSITSILFFEDKE